MAIFSTPATLLDSQASALRTQLRGVFDGDAEAVHQARVATRRIRELLALRRATTDEQQDDADVAKGFAAIGKALGRVRDVDVRIALLRELEAHTPQAAPSLVVVRQHHGRKRLDDVRHLIKTLEHLDVASLIKSVTRNHPENVRTRLIWRGWREPHRRQLLERACAAAEGIAHATGVYFPNRVHHARIAIKRLRYAAEIAAATGSPRFDPPIRQLSKVQTTLGNLHDRQTLADWLSRHEKRAGVGADELEVTREVLSSEVQTLHAKYLARRAEVLAAVAEIEGLAVVAGGLARALQIGSAVAVTGCIWTGWLLSDRRDRSSALRAKMRASA
jgi:CHAD domain-containing protein